MNNELFEMPTPVDYHLDNGEKLHAANPTTFIIPHRIKRENLAVGTLVKLVFLLDDPPADQPNGERMWVKISALQGRNYVGELRNEPVLVKGSKLGDLIEFGPEHIIDIHE